MAMTVSLEHDWALKLHCVSGFSVWVQASGRGTVHVSDWQDRTLVEVGESRMINRSRLSAAMLVFSLVVTVGKGGDVLAQATSGTILGRVTDQQQAIVSKATVTARK